MAETDFSSAQNNSNPTTDQTADTDGLVQYLLVALAGQEYAVRLATLQEVLRSNSVTIAPVPNTPVWLEGIFSLRGQIISVVNLKTFLNLADPVDDSGPADRLSLELFGIGAAVPRLLVLHSQEVLVGVLGDDIKGVLFVDPAQVQPPRSTDRPPFKPAYLEGSYTDPSTGRQTWLLDTDLLLGSPEMLAFEPVLM